MRHTHHGSVPHQLTGHPQQRVGSTCRRPGRRRPSGSNLLQTRWCPSGPPTSWGMFLPTRSRAASSGWRYWGRPCPWGKRGALLAPACGAERGCRRTQRHILGDARRVTTLQTQQDTEYLPPPPARSCFFSFFFSNIRTRRDLESKSLSYSKDSPNIILREQLQVFTSKQTSHSTKKLLVMDYPSQRRHCTFSRLRTEANGFLLLLK